MVVVALPVDLEEGHSELGVGFAVVEELIGLVDLLGSLSSLVDGGQGLHHLGRLITGALHQIITLTPNN